MDYSSRRFFQAGFLAGLSGSIVRANSGYQLRYPGPTESTLNPPACLHVAKRIAPPAN